MRDRAVTYNNIFNYFYLFCIVIFAGSATAFARSLGDIRTVGNLFALVLTGFFIGQNRIRFNQNFLYTILIFIIYASLTFINNHRISPLWLVQWMILFTISYCICQVFGLKLFEAYEKIIVFLCIVSIPFWISLVIFPDFTTSFVKSTSIFDAYQGADNVFANNFFFTVPPRDYHYDDFSILARNAGFAWEPGAFASFICLAIFCNLVRRNNRFRKNVSLVILLFTLLTTQSTTGYIILILLIFLWLLLNKKYLLCCLSIPVCVMLFSLPFIQEKLSEEFIGLQNADLSEVQPNALGRMHSLLLDFQEFERHPILGLGGYTDGTWLMQNGYNDIVTISGIGKLLSMFGLIMTIVFLLMLIKSSKFISNIFRNNNGYLLIIVVLGVMASYNLWTQPIFISFWMFSIFSIKSNPRVKITKL